MQAKKTIIACALAAAIAAVPLAGCSSQGAGDAGADSATSPAQTSAPAAAASGDDASAGASEEFVLYLGTNDKDTNEPVYSKEESKERVKAILMDNFGGYTIQEAEGGWRSDDGTEYQEYTLVIYLSDTNIDAVHAAAKELIKEFNQSSVLINTQQLAESEFYSGE